MLIHKEYFVWEISFMEWIAVFIGGDLANILVPLYTSYKTVAIFPFIHIFSLHYEFSFDSISIQYVPLYFII